MILRGGEARMDKYLKYILPIYLVLYFSTAFFWRSYIVWRRTGVNPFVLGKTDSAHDFIGRVFKIIFALTIMVVIIYSASARLYNYLMPIAWLQSYSFQVLGLILLLLSLIWTLLAQSQMGNSWRIGVDTEHETALVRKGVFKLSRNPIFLGMIMTLLGLFLIIPNAITLLVLVLGTVIIQVQVRLEEEHLTRLHKESYLDYQRCARRWI
jgi:protein-S-isoprenylcysteine O-methyltransferase Ste14